MISDKWEAWLIDPGAYDKNGSEIPITERLDVEGTNINAAKVSFLNSLHTTGVTNLRKETVKMPTTVKITHIYNYIRVKNKIDKRFKSRPDADIQSFSEALKNNGGVA